MAIRTKVVDSTHRHVARRHLSSEQENEFLFLLMARPDTVTALGASTLDASCAGDPTLCGTLL